MARIHPVAVALVGIWLAWTVAMWFAATRSFRTVDRVLAKPSAQFERAIQPLGPETSRTVLRHLASEINRTYFGVYGLAQILLGLALFGLLWYQKPRDTASLALAGVMLVLVVILAAIIEPMIVSLGRSIDFLPRNPAPPQMPRFWMLHGAFTGLDAVKFLAGLGLLVRLILKRPA